MPDDSMGPTDDVVARLAADAVVLEITGRGGEKTVRDIREAIDRIITLKRERVDKADAWDAIAEKNAKIAGLRAEVERLRAALKPFAKVADMLLFSGATTANEIELSGEQLFGALMAARAATTRQGETDDAAPDLGTRLLKHLTDQALKREMKP